MFLSILKIIKNKIRFELEKLEKKEPYKYNLKTVDIAKEIKKSSFAVVPDFYTPDECKKLRKEIDLLIEKRVKNNTLWTDVLKSDSRCFAAEDDSELIAGFFYNTFLSDVGSTYFDGKVVCSNTLAARINYKKGNIGSGQGWHRDGNNFQFKAIVYLSDVEIKDGPFQIIKGSHKFFNVLKDTLTMKTDGENTRFSNQEVEKIISKNRSNYTALTAKAGTLVFVDVSSIHTGMPLSENGERYTLFNYFYPSYDDIEKRKKVFKNSSAKKDYV